MQVVIMIMMMMMVIMLMLMLMITMKRRRRRTLLQYIHLLCKTLAAHAKLLTRREEGFSLSKTLSSHMLCVIGSILPRRNAGGHLASVRNAEEQEQMEKLVTGRWIALRFFFFFKFSSAFFSPGWSGQEGIWLGGTDAGREGKWTWVDGSVVNHCLSYD